MSPATAGARARARTIAREQPPKPPEFELPLPDVAVWAGPKGIGGAPFEELAEPETVDLPTELGDDPAVALRRTLGLFATGVTIITTRTGEQVHGMTANAFMSVSLEPPLVLISVDRRTRMCQLLHEGRRYGVSVLHEDQSALSDLFAGRAVDDAPAPRFPSSTTRRWWRARWPTSSRASRAPTGAGTTRSSSVRSRAPATARARRCSSTAGATAKPGGG